MNTCILAARLHVLAGALVFAASLSLAVIATARRLGSPRFVRAALISPYVKPTPALRARRRSVHFRCVHFVLMRDARSPGNRNSWRIPPTRPSTRGESGKIPARP